jgi:pyrroloquinoline quinone biosynthesis protein E
MAGWGAVFLVVAPDGVALPCHSARMLPGLEFPNLRDTSVRAAWHDSAAFNAYRGDAWMNDTCGTCDERHADHAGCRCQAFLVAGDAAATDPVCRKSEHRDRIDAMLADASQRVAPAAPLRFVAGAAKGGGLVFRGDAMSLALSEPGAARDATGTVA